ncbi:MAG: hypothetical protein WDA42_09030 [Candidatus Bathyarchaeia archaeon]|jgi:hypothetical protein
MAITDIYGRQLAFGGAFSADAALLTFNGSEDMLVTQIQWNYPQTVKMLRSLSSNAAYIHAGPAGEQPGQLALGQIIGPKGMSKTFVEQFADVCNIEDNSLTLSMLTGCGDITDEESLTFHYCVLSNFGGQASVQDFLFMQNLQLAFYALSLD